MKEPIIISSYCSVTKERVTLNNKVIFTNTSDNFRDIANDIYSKFSIDYPKFHKMDPLSKLGFLSVELLLGDKKQGWKCQADKTGLVFMNSASSIDSDRLHQDTLSDRDHYFPSPSIFVYTLPNIVIGEICIRHKFFGEGNFFVSENFDTDLLYTYIKELFDSESVECCIAGWVESDKDDFESLVFLIGKQDNTDTGIAIFEADIIKNLYEKLK